MKKALLFEIHPYHEVLIPGLVNILEDCGFSVELLIHETINLEDIFDRYTKELKVYRFNYDNIEYVCNQMGGINSFDYLFFSSLEFLHDEKYDSAFEFLNSLETITIPFAGIIHTPDKLEEINGAWMAREGRVLTLSEGSHLEYPLCIPTYFGEFKKRYNNNKIIFLVGQSNDVNYIARQIQEVIDNGHQSDFEVRVAGDFSFSRILCKSLAKKMIDVCFRIIGKSPKYNIDYRISMLFKIKFLGKISYREMFKEIENASFIDIAIDPDKSKQFYTGRTTGALLLSYGFDKPCILEERYAKAYKVNSTEGVVYTKGNLGLLNAVEMSDDIYATMVRNVDFQNKLLECKSKTSIMGSLFATNC